MDKGGGRCICHEWFCHTDHLAMRDSTGKVAAVVVHGQGLIVIVVVPGWGLIIVGGSCFRVSCSMVVMMMIMINCLSYYYKDC